MKGLHLCEGVGKVGREGAVDLGLQLGQVDLDHAVVLAALIWSQVLPAQTAVKPGPKRAASCKLTGCLADKGPQLRLLAASRWYRV